MFMFLNIPIITNAVKSLIAIELVLLGSFYYIQNYKDTNKNKGRYLMAEKKTAPISGYNLPQLNVALEIRQEFLRRSLEAINGVIKFEPDFCLRNHSNAYNKEKAKSWMLDEKKLTAWLFDFNGTKDKCESIKSKLSFNEKPLFAEENDFTLAYGILAHKNSAQVFFLLSAIYNPQNVYCIGIDNKAEEKFRKEIELLGFCLPNVYLIYVGEIHWCTISVLRALFKCFQFLTELGHNWKYFQYISGFDLPLKTNLEMVRIFMQLNETVNVEVVPKPDDLLKPAKEEFGVPPMPIWKSSMSALIPRQTANFTVNSPLSMKLIRWLEPSVCPDESFWATVTGNAELNTPGGFNASKVNDKIQDERVIKKGRKLSHGTKSAAEPFEIFEYYISRFQIWGNSENFECRGKYVSGSCVYGAEDFQMLVERPELVAHKFYWDFEPAIYFCMYKTIRERALNLTSQQQFRGEVYSKLPQVRIKAGESIEDVDFLINVAL